MRMMIMMGLIWMLIIRMTRIKMMMIIVTMTLLVS